MNRLGDCICALPAKHPLEHAKGCPVYLRAKGWGNLDAFTEFVLSGLGSTATWIAAKLERSREPQRSLLMSAGLHITEAMRELAEAMGAGADQAPGEAPDARESAPRRAAAPFRWHPPATPSNQRDGISYRFSADGSCLCVTIAVEAQGQVIAGRYAHPDCRASHDVPAVGVCTEGGPEVLDPRMIPQAPPFGVGAWACTCTWDEATDVGRNPDPVAMPSERTRVHIDPHCRFHGGQ